MNLQQRTRKQHYVPRCYLARFTHDATKKGRFHVYDFETGKRRVDTPDNVAFKPELYQYTASAPQDVEDGFAHLEGIVCRQIEAIEASLALPADDSEMGALLTWLAIQRERVPKVIDARARFHERTATILLQYACADERRYESALKCVEQQTGKGEKRVPLNDMQNFAASVPIRITNNAFRMAKMFQGIEALSDLLYRRSWTLLIAPRGTPEFITSDNPVSLVPTQRIAGAMRGQPLGFGIPGTIVMYPLTPRLAMSGALLAGPPQRRTVRELSADMVVELNSATIMTATRCVYSRRKRIYRAARPLVGVDRFCMAPLREELDAWLTSGRG